MEFLRQFVQGSRRHLSGRAVGAPSDACRSASYVDIHNEPLGTGSDGEPVFLKDLWPSRQEVEETVARALKAEMFRSEYGGQPERSRASS